MSGKRDKGSSPLGLMVVAGIIAAGFAAVHLGGLREYVVVFSGGSPGGGPPALWEVAGGVFYVVLFLAVVTVVPVLLLGAALFVGLQWLRPGDPRATPDQ